MDSTHENKSQRRKDEDGIRNPQTVRALTFVAIGHSVLSFAARDRLRPRLASPFASSLHACHTGSRAVRRQGWVYEEKYDGDRTLAYKEGNDRFPVIQEFQRQDWGFSEDSSRYSKTEIRNLVARRRRRCVRQDE